MAFNYFLRRAPASVLPLGRKFLPLSRFSTMTDSGNLLDLIESGYSAQRSSNASCLFPMGFPFQIEENKKYPFKCQFDIIKDQKRYIFRRKWQDEIIEVAADGYEVVDDKPVIPMNANILKGTQQLLFEMTAEPNQINIHSCIIRNNVTGHLKALEKDLEIRGFNSSTINFLFSYIGKQIPSYDVVRLIESDYSPQQSLNVPDDFPFEFAKGSKSGNFVVFLNRRFEDEIIKAEVEVKLPWNSRHTFGITVEIVCGVEHIKFLLDVLPHDPHPIRIFEMTMRGRLESFQRFLEIRGIKPSTTKVLLDYFKKKNEQ